MLLAQKERLIAHHEEERRRLNQSLTAAERELHSLRSSVNLKDREKSVSKHVCVCWDGVCISLCVLKVLDEELGRMQAEVHRSRNEVTALRVGGRSLTVLTVPHTL